MRELLHDFSESPLRVCPPLLLEPHMRQAKRELREEIIDGKKALHAVTLDAVGIKLENRRGPRRVVPLAVAFEFRRVVLHVHPGGQEMLVHEPHHAFVRPHLGIQPSTATSHWGGAEVEEYRLLLGVRVLQDLINVMAKLDWHGMLAGGNRLEYSHVPEERLQISGDHGRGRPQARVEWAARVSISRSDPHALLREACSGCAAAASERVLGSVEPSGRSNHRVNRAVASPPP